MEQGACNGEYHVAGDRFEMRGGRAGVEAFDFAGFANME
jgi:hypothetical protein